MPRRYIERTEKAKDRVLHSILEGRTATPLQIWDYPLHTVFTGEIARRDEHGFWIVIEKVVGFLPFTQLDGIDPKSLQAHNVISVRIAHPGAQPILTRLGIKSNNCRKNRRPQPITVSVTV